MINHDLKSSVEEIRQRFDNDVERFSNLEVGQTTTIGAPIMMTLVTQAAAATTPHATHLLDVGCGAGNYSLKLLQSLPDLNVTLLDLSQPMLNRAVERVSSVTDGEIMTLQADIREAVLGKNQYDVILAAAVLHHLRGDEEWLAVFAKFHSILKPGGSVWIVDLVEHDVPPIQSLMWGRYSDYLISLKDEAYRDHVYDYVEHEDTPRSLIFQLDLLRKVGFDKVTVLHKNGCFAAFGAIKSLE
jgi:tRNA (cmo5U34)-methyltransferase